MPATARQEADDGEHLLHRVERRDEVGHPARRDLEHREAVGIDRRLGTGANGVRERCRRDGAERFEQLARAARRELLQSPVAVAPCGIGDGSAAKRVESSQTLEFEHLGDLPVPLGMAEPRAGEPRAEPRVGGQEIGFGKGDESVARLGTRGRQIQRLLQVDHAAGVADGARWTPAGRVRGSLDEFRAYTRSSLPAAQDGDGGTFRVWSTDAEIVTGSLAGLRPST